MRKHIFISMIALMICIISTGYTYAADDISSASSWYDDPCSDGIYKNVTEYINDGESYTTLFSTWEFTYPEYGPFKYDLVKLSAFASSTTYVSKSFARKKGLYKNSATLSFLKKCGFKECKKLFSAKYSLNKNEKCTTQSTKNCNHHCTIYTGGQVIDNGERLIALIISGYTPDHYEWVSNFEIGRVNYHNAEGNYHQGFYEATKEVLNMIEKQYEDVIAKGNVKFWITGHSRGAAITNLVAKELTEKFGEDKVFACAFATPNVADKSKVNKSYKNIINFVNSGDFVPYVVPSEWGYSKSGQVITFNMNKVAKKLYMKYTGYRYSGTTKKQRVELIKHFSIVGNSVNKYYKKSIAKKYAPADYGKKGIAMLGKGDYTKGITYMLKLGTKDKSNKVAELNLVIGAQEGSEVLKANVYKISTWNRLYEYLVSKKINNTPFNFLAAHHMEAYLAYVNTDEFAYRQDFLGGHA